MSTSRIEEDFFLDLDTGFYQEQIGKVIDYFLPQFIKLSRRYFLFNLFFSIFIALQLIVTALLFSYLRESYLLGIGISLLFLSFFSFFTCRAYLISKRPFQVKELLNRYIKSSKHLIHYREGIPEHQLTLANACCQFETALRGQEYAFFAPLRRIQSLATWADFASCWLHWQDVFFLRESLLQTSIEEHIKLVKSQPTNLEAHASLASAYVLLSTLYRNTDSSPKNDEEKWVPPTLYGPEMEKKFRNIAKKAVEELLIIRNFSPNDPWVHAQLAYSYHDLDMPQEEIQEYEAILKLCPGDKDTLYKLGTLYFKEGMNAKGLQIYEELRRSHYAKAESLIQFYG